MSRRSKTSVVVTSSTGFLKIQDLDKPWRPEDAHSNHSKNRVSSKKSACKLRKKRKRSKKLNKNQAGSTSNYKKCTN